MDINKHLIKSIEDSMDSIGLTIELSKDFDKNFFNVDEEIKDGNIRTHIKGGTLDSHMFLYTFTEMLKNNEITILFNENANEHDKNYLKKLSKSF